MRILGIDPGLRTTGFGVVESNAGRLRYVASGTIQTDAVAIGELPQRLKIIFDGVREVSARYRPDCAAVEVVFVNVNPQSTLLLGQARGAAIAAAVLAGLPVSEYTAGRIKQAVVGGGRAAKTQVQAMVMRLLGLPAAPQPDAADALAAAICHAHATTGLGAVATGRRGGRTLRLGGR
ncbi:MAG: crossover junction endodeoxyribonuclease RuvC [Betaproteobacteria bacterium]|nr:crossover junction endodeoxyribonuclease RuvC [Betaproteobacteria bacterium]